MDKIKIKFWHYGIVVTLLISAILGYNLFKGDKSLFLAGDASHGHYQIELECNSCHVESFSNDDLMQQACEGCHAKELDAANDKHPKKKFLDPRNAELLQQLDARYCVTCHTEHKPEITRKYGVTIAPDFCFHCHEDIAKDRPSHAPFEFDSCASSGCHNYHDNSMLYEDFLIRHAGEEATFEQATLPPRTALIRWLKKNKKVKPLSSQQHDGQKLFTINTQSDNKGKRNNATNKNNQVNSIVTQWADSPHATTAVNCSQCHNDNNQSSPHLKFNNNQLEVCSSCHERQADQFVLGKHGMRQGLGLPLMSTADARQGIDTTQDKLLTCSSCHNPHSLDVSIAAVESCLGCHQDEHSKNYKSSVHFTLWQQEQNEELEEGSGVTCASCHLPRIKKGKRVRVMHNQNHNLRPNSKMLKTVCMNCHGVEFSLDALADEALIEKNFSGQPDSDLQTFKLIEQRIKKRQQRRNQ